MYLQPLLSLTDRLALRDTAIDRLDAINGLGQLSYQAFVIPHRDPKVGQVDEKQYRVQPHEPRRNVGPYVSAKYEPHDNKEQNARGGRDEMIDDRPGFSLQAEPRNI